MDILTLHSQGLSIRQIADQLGITRYAVSKALRQHGIRPQAVVYKHIADEYASTDATIPYLAKKYGISVSTVHSAIIEFCAPGIGKEKLRQANQRRK